MTDKFTGADLFCGAGGSSEGLFEALKELSIEISDFVAVNHWELAIATHKANHPDVRHLIEDVTKVNPFDAVPSGKLTILIGSPECVFHSNARGGKPVDDQRRISARAMIDWARILKPTCVLIENVPEFKDWGPLDETDHPIKTAKGKFFLEFIRDLKVLGYQVDYRDLICANYGDATTRKRLFILAHLSKKPVWPEPTHAKRTDKNLFSTSYKPWRPAREIIDWSLKGESIFNRKRPLKPNTMRRIFKGLEKYSGMSFVLPNEGFYRGNAPRSVDEPIPSVTSRGAGHLVEPFLVKLYGNSNAADVDQPCPTITAKGQHIALVEPFLTAYHGSSYPGGERVNSVDEPMPVIDTSNRYGLVQPFVMDLIYPNGHDSRTHSVGEPLRTLTSFDTKGLVQPFLMPVHHGTDQRTWSIENPVPTVTAFDGMGLVQPYLVKYNSTGGAQSIDDPLDTITSKDRFGLVVVLFDGSLAILDIFYRMLQPHELAAATGFRKNYIFLGNREDKVKQIGNAVPVKTAKALCMSLMSL